jgi:pimeloyl-ACP methyl ester carboxylesterase
MNRLTTTYVDLDDVKVAYREHGSGTPLLLLHGNSASKRMFAGYQTRHFSRFRTFAIDSRGHGQTVSNDDSYSIDQYSNDVIRFCKAKGISEAFVIGYSDGGNIALLLAKKAPLLFKRIVAISPNYLASGTKESMLAWIRRIARFLDVLGRLGFDTRRQRMRVELMLRDIGISDDDLRSVQTSLQILYAEKDLIQEAHILRIAALVPGSIVKKILGCSHLSIFHSVEAIVEMQGYLGAP